MQQNGLVLGRNVVDTHGFSQTILDGLGQLVDVALSCGGVLDLFVGDGRSVHRHKRLVAHNEFRCTHESSWIENNVAVHPQHATVARCTQCTHEGLRGVGGVVLLVVDEVHIRECFDDVLKLVTNHNSDVCVVPKSVTYVFHLLLHDGAAVAEFSQRLRQRAAKTATHASGKNYYLCSHDKAPCVVSDAPEEQEKRASENVDENDTPLCLLQFTRRLPEKARG